MAHNQAWSTWQLCSLLSRELGGLHQCGETLSCQKVDQGDGTQWEKGIAAVSRVSPLSEHKELISFVFECWIFTRGMTKGKVIIHSHPVSDILQCHYRVIIFTGWSGHGWWERGYNRWTNSQVDVLIEFQVEEDSAVNDSKPHIANIGRMVEVSTGAASSQSTFSQQL